MSRPIKIRRICHIPKAVEFIPNSNNTDKVIMSIDEFETIRLLDYLGFTQEQCAKQMNVARPTVTLIYEKARKKIADSLVNGKQLIIKGGNVKECSKNENCCGKCGINECDICNNDCKTK